MATFLILVVVAVAYKLAMLFVFDPPRPKVRPQPKARERFDDDEISRTAVHEAGHALAAWSCSVVGRIDFVRIEEVRFALMRSIAGKVAHTFEDDNTPNSAWCHLVIALAGLAAEGAAYDKMRSKPAQDDLVEALALAAVVAGTKAPFQAPPGKVLPFAEMYKGEKIAPSDPRLQALAYGYRMAKRVIDRHGRALYRIAALLAEKRSLSERDLEQELGSRSMVRMVRWFRPTFVYPRSAEDRTAA